MNVVVAITAVVIGQSTATAVDYWKRETAD